VIELLDVTQHYGVRPVLRGISLRIERGEVVTILGPNGMGKSTLLGVTAGVLSSLSGWPSGSGASPLPAWRSLSSDGASPSRYIQRVSASKLVYLMIYEGLRRGFDHFPWKHLEMPTADSDLTAGRGPSGMWGWPYDRMLREVVGDQSISRIDAILCCMLGSLWLFVLTSFIADPNDRRIAMAFPFVAALALCPLGRLYIYVMEYIFPITLWARIWTGRWLIPDYDQVFVGPICAFLVGPLSLALLRAWRVPLDFSLPIATGLIPLVALITPPRLKRWRLTGQHRIVHAMSFATAQAGSKVAKFVKVG
jgi:energy-coupling factor transporter ATP-binding protein EcfA2